MEAILYCSAAVASEGAVGVGLAWDWKITDAADGLSVGFIEATPPTLAQILADILRVAAKDWVSTVCLKRETWVIF